VTYLKLRHTGAVKRWMWASRRRSRSLPFPTASRSRTAASTQVVPLVRCLRQSGPRGQEEACFARSFSCQTSEYVSGTPPAESLGIALHLLIQPLGRRTIQGSQLRIEDHFAPAQNEDRSPHTLQRDEEERSGVEVACQVIGSDGK
jgi:hypothetical protein